MLSEAVMGDKRPRADAVTPGEDTLDDTLLVMKD
jgi:hypothetical protein